MMFARMVLIGLIGVLLLGCNQQKEPRVQYNISIDKETPRLAQVKAEFVLQDSVLHMSPHGPVPERWVEYVGKLTVTDAKGEKLEVTKTEDHNWRLNTPLGQPVTLSYQVELTHDQREWPGGIDGVAYKTDWGVFYSGRSLFVMNGDERENIRVNFDLPDNWKVSTPWVTTESVPHSYEVMNQEDLAESLIFAGELKEVDLKRGDLVVQFVLAGDKIIAQQDKFHSLAYDYMDYYIDLMGGLPQNPSGMATGKTMVLINQADQTDGEVIGSHISMLMNPDDPPQQQMVAWFMFAHEFFHLWNGKTLTVESTREDWFKEGITNYYTLKAMYQVDFINEQALMGIMNGLFYQRYTNDPGYGEMSMRDAASAFLKDDHWGLVYGGGLFAGISLDMMIREETNNKKSLDDLMQQFYQTYAGNQTNYSTKDVLQKVNELSGRDTSAFFETYITGHKPVPVSRYLEKAGYEVSTDGGQLRATPISNMSAEQEAIHAGFLGKLNK